MSERICELEEIVLQQHGKIETLRAKLDNMDRLYSRELSRPNKRLRLGVGPLSVASGT